MRSVRSGSTNQANSAFHPFGVGKWVVINVITWITDVETIKRQAVWLFSCGLSLQTIGCTSALACDEQRYGSCSCH